ncbi:MAG: TIR domain-containing protein, partial [Clostridiales bacterium]|nr:TIR domain-containing protein [Clostridiales bacterium]
MPENGSAEGIFYLKRVKEMQLDEYGITQWINRTSSRVLPVLESVEQLILAPPDQTPSFVRNTVTVMESLALKGRPLRYYINEYSQFTAAQTFHIIRQVLFALRDVHQAGFLHLDIQDGNLYVRGALEDESSLVTMIDFGCARMMKDGKTEPIKDCVIFTTVGFTAPEILFGNNGTLRLGPEADIYSVGCLMLYLLTGNRVDTISLVNNHTRKYLTRFNLRKINCPRHLTDRMQEIIAHALENDPADRYHSVGEMLADVNEFIKAMEPNRNDLSAVSYDAFVCYRHGVIDSAAAVALQRGLEHFRPSFIKHRPFNRVFVDEGELSSCANFGEQIRSALKNAGWLIVICSSSTPGSIWVRQEIDIFLEYHDRSRILAVLTEGEPENAFPPQLFGKSVKEQVMAADARGKNLKEILIRLNRDALLRVAAPMMGLTYDSLKQRKRTYAFQRAAAVASISAVLFGIFAVYAIYQNCQITRQTRIAMEQSAIAAEQTERANMEYKNALLNQGKVFAEQAQSALDKGDIMGAVELAVSALSTDPDGYTNIPTAEYVLTQALALYETENSNSAIAQSGSFRHDNYVDNFFVNDEEGILFSSDGDQIYLWDVEDCTLLQTIKPGIEGDYRITLQEDLHDAEEKRLFFSSESSLGGTIQCYDYEKQEYAWITSLDLTESFYRFSSIYRVRESDRLVCMAGPDLFVLDASDGRLLWQETFDIEDEVLRMSFGDDIKYGPMAASRDGNKIFINLPRNYKDSSSWDASWAENQDIVVLDLENYSSKVISPECGIIGDLVCKDDDSLLLAGYRGYYGGKLMTGNGQSTSILYEKNTAIFALVDAETGEKQWVQEMEFTGDTRMNIALTRYRDEEDLSAAMITYGNRCAVLNLNTGAVWENWEFSAPVCLLDFLDENKGFWVVTEDGCYHKCHYSNQLRTNKIECFPNCLDKIIKGENYYFVLSHSAASSHSNIIVRYDFDRHDNNWRELCMIDLSFPSYDLDSGYFIISRYDSPTIYYVKPDEGVNLQLCRADIIHEQSSDIRVGEMLGVYEVQGEDKLLLDCSYDDGHINSCIACIDIKTGESDLLHIPIPGEGYYSVDNRPVVGYEADPVNYYTD